MQISFFNPTRLVFGKGKLKELGSYAKEYGKKALIVYGGGSIKKNGVFDSAVASLKEAGIEIVECGGIEPNPKIDSVRRGIELIRKNGCDLIIAIGGGSAMDCSKAIGAGALYDGDPWDMIFHGQENVYIPTRCMPIITVPTLAATGSEMNPGAVISNSETHEKSFVQTDALFPKVAVVDPTLTLTVPKNQTGYGVCDIIVHLTESYFNGVDGTPIQDEFALATIKNCMQYGLKAYQDGSDLEAREQVQWSSILALNGFVNCGTNAGFPVHMIEHTVSGIYDITHAAGLAIINPSWMRCAITHGGNVDKFARFATYLFDVQNDGDKVKTALAGVDKYEEFLKKIGCPVRFSELDIDESNYEKI
ncbi:MAG: iron-containing alcohol dehydrogenase, partial [Succinivibrio sp.]|nr:iron-containing alcohol dehydrogenase [Succinivibrio sp.]